MTGASIPLMGPGEDYQALSIKIRLSIHAKLNTEMKEEMTNITQIPEFSIYDGTHDYAEDENALSPLAGGWRTMIRDLKNIDWDEVDKELVKDDAEEAIVLLVCMYVFLVSMAAIINLFKHLV